MSASRDESIRAAGSGKRLASDVIAVKVTGFVILAIGCAWLAAGQLAGLVVVFAGKQLLLHPTDRASPLLHAIVELIQRRLCG